VTGETMTVTTQPCISCGKRAQLEVVKSEYEAWQGGQLIQRAMPSLPESQRELLISGTCDACWDELFADDDEECE